MKNKKYIKKLDYLNHSTGEVETLSEYADFSFSNFLDASELNLSMLRGEKFVKVSCNDEEYTLRIEDILKCDTTPNPDYLGVVEGE